MSSDIEAWALPRLKRLLPLDDESLREVLTYTSALSKQDAADHLKNFLGDSPQSLEFISSYNSRREDVIVIQPSRQESKSRGINDGVPSPRRKINQKQKAPLHKAGPVRRPDGFGDVTGGYNKNLEDDIYVSRTQQKSHSANQLAENLSLSQNHVALQTPKISQGGPRTPSPGHSRNPSPGLVPSPKPPPSASGSLISDLPNVRSKQSKRLHGTNSQPHSGTSTPHGKLTTTTTSSIADLTSAIVNLEIATNPTLSTERRKCECNASIHPLFATAPNCLNCGKIICAFEGLQPCSFCDAPILTKDQVTDMIKALKEERGVERMATHNANASLSERGTPMFSSTPDSSSGDEGSSAAVRARAHRDKLLAFQRENAQRTQVHDEAADYDMTLTPGATQWMSPLQRAAALKKQQKYLRELEEANRPDWEKKRTVMSMSIKNGKLVKTYGREKAPVAEPESESEDDTVSAPPAGVTDSHGHDVSFSHNPLLASGKLVRPIWKSKEDDTSVKDKESTRQRQSVWRKVQDDNEDNEQWILDGGLRGYEVENRLLEDGSQRECG